MSEESKKVIGFNETMQELFIDMKKTLDKYGLKRINSIILLKGLLEEKESILYDCLCATSNVQNPYKQIIEDCEEELIKLQGKEKELSKDEEPFVILMPTEGSIEVFLTEDVKKIISETVTNLLEEESEENEDCENPDNLDNIEEDMLQIIVDTEDILVSLMYDMPKDVLNILKNNGVYLEAIIEYYNLLTDMYENITVEGIEDTNNLEKIPKAISDFVTVLSAKYKGKSECEILERDKECKDIMRTLQKRGRKNVILLGEAGVGKSAIAEKIAFDIANGNCPESLKEHVVLQLNVNSSIAGTMYRGMAEERFKLVIDFLENHENVILFIDEIHMVIGAGETSSNKNDMANALKPFLASKNAKVIGATTQEEYNKIILTDSAFQRRFKKVVVKEPRAKQVYPMLKNAIKEHEKFHGVTISKEMVEYAILISSCFNNNTNNPDRTNDLIDSAMVIAKEYGKNEVDRECILENFDINFEKYNEMDNYNKKSIAYHEAGHYLVWRLSSHILKDYKSIAVSIMPAEDYLGVTVYDNLSDEVTVYPNRKYFIALLAQTLAGREAEKIFTSDISSGAESDLEKVNKRAYDMISRYGLGKENDFKTYFESKEYHMISESIIDKIDREKEEVIKEAIEYADNILKKNKVLLEKLVDALLEKRILDENDLDEVFS